MDYIVYRKETCKIIEKEDGNAKIIITACYLHDTIDHKLFNDTNIQIKKIEKLLEDRVITLPDEEIERYMYWFSKRKLEENGYIHYEISNFAKIPYRSKHNLDCWRQKEYLGFGVSASSYKNDIRYKNIENGNEEKNIIIEEKQDKKTKMNEYMILGLRKINGINIDEFRRKFEVSPLYIYNKELTNLVREGLINIDTNNIRLSKKGLDLANIVWEEFI